MQTAHYILSFRVHMCNCTRGLYLHSRANVAHHVLYTCTCRYDRTHRQSLCSSVCIHPVWRKGPCKGRLQWGGFEVTRSLVLEAPCSHILALAWLHMSVTILHLLLHSAHLHSHCYRIFLHVYTLFGLHQYPLHKSNWTPKTNWPCEVLLLQATKLQEMWPQPGGPN